MKTLPLTLVAFGMCTAVALAKEKPVVNYQNAVLQETHAEPVRMNCYGIADSRMSNCHDAQVLIYTVKIGPVVYALTPYNTRIHRESLWQMPAGSTVSTWNDGNHFHVRIGTKESQYDIISESVEDASR